VPRVKEGLPDSRPSPVKWFFRLTFVSPSWLTVESRRRTCVSYLAEPFARPLSDCPPRDLENCFNALTPLLPRRCGWPCLDKIDASLIERWRKGGVTLSRRYLRSVMSTISARVKRSSTVVMAFRTSNISTRRPQCASSGQEQRSYAVALTHGIG